jgi:hypothetical protein
MKTVQMKQRLRVPDSQEGRTLSSGRNGRLTRGGHPMQLVKEA